MQIIKILERFDYWICKRKKRLWQQGWISLKKVKNEMLNKVVRYSITFGILISIICGVLIVRESVKGDYSITEGDRTGAVCNDGWISYSTSLGACSHHNGVDYWTYSNTSMHHMIIELYCIVLATTFSFMILFSIFSVAFRHFFYACIVEGIYFLGYAIFMISFLILEFSLIVIIPSIALYTILKVLISKKE